METGKDMNYQKTFHWAISIVITAILVSGVLWYAYELPLPSFGKEILTEHLLKCDKNKVLRSKVITKKECIEFKTVTSTPKCIKYKDVEFINYLYNTEVEVPQQKFKGLDEDISKRTKNTQSFPMENGQRVLNMYPGEPFHKDGNKWFKAEDTIIPKEDFDAQMGTLGLLRLFVKNVFAACPDSECYAGAGDGTIQGTHSSYATARTVANSAFSSIDQDWMAINSDLGTFYVNKAYFPIPTSEIGGGEVVLSAEFYFYIWDVPADSVDNDAIRLVTATQADHTTLTTSDYNSIGSTAVATDIDIGDLTNGIYNFFTLTDFTVIKKSGEAAICGNAQTGLTCLGVRTIREIAATQPSNHNAVKARYSEYADITFDPYLSVTLGVVARRIIPVY